MRIELCHPIGVCTFHLNLTQIIIPFIFRLFLYPLEIPPGILGLQVLAGILHGNIRNTYFILYLLLLVHIECKIDSGRTTFSKGSPRFQFISFPGSRLQGIRIKFCHEIDFVRRTKTTEITTFRISFTSVRSSDCNGSLFNRSSTPADNNCSVLLIHRKFIVCHTRSFRYSQLYLNILLYGSLIVTGMSLFIGDIDATVQYIVR